MQFREIESEQVINARFDGFTVETTAGTFEIVSATSTYYSDPDVAPSITMHGFYLRKDGERKASQRYSGMLRVATVLPASYAPFDDPWEWENHVMDEMSIEIQTNGNTN